MNTLKTIQIAKKYKTENNELIIRLFEIPNNNHGCLGFEIEIFSLNNKEGLVVAGRSCDSCWQVGHDNDQSPIPIGAIVLLPKGYGWKRASAIDKKYMQIDCSIVEKTKITPYQVDAFFPSAITDRYFEKSNKLNR